MNHETLTLQEAAERAGVSPSTLRRWAASGVIPQVRAANGEDWTPAAASHARVVARLRHRGHKLEEIREATKQGRLAYGFLEDKFPDSQGTRTLEDAVEATGLQPALIERFWTSLGLPGQGLENLTDDDIQALQYAASVLASGFPLVAFLQLARVYGQALARIADAEVRLFHIYVHEPLIREGLPGLQMAEEMEHLAHLVFQGVGQVKLKGFNETVQLCRAQTPEGQ